MIYIDVIIIVTLLLLAVAIAVSIWSATRTGANSKPSFKENRLAFFLVGMTIVLLLIGWTALPVNDVQPSTAQRLANMFILTIGVMLLSLIFIALWRGKSR